MDIFKEAAAYVGTCRCLCTNMPLSAGSDVLLMAGQIDSTSTATALIKTKVQDVERSFQERFMGVIAYGRKVIRPEALFIGNVSFS